jgi:hypothetical protein
MTNPFMRGSAPGRAQPASLRPGSFKQGHEKRGGRKRGTPNLLSIDYKKAILEAAYRIGHDGNGKDGALGYFSWVAQRHPRIIAGVPLLKLARLENVVCDAPEDLRRSIDELNNRVRDYIGPLGKNPKSQAESEAPWGWTGQPFPVGSLMQLAVENPKEFCKLCVAAFLRPPTKRRRPQLQS